MSAINKLRLAVVLIIFIALGVASIWLLLPPANESGKFYSPFGTPTTIVDLVLAIGGGVLFLRALRNFKEALKPAWRSVALAQFALGTLTLLFPIIEYYYLWPNVWWNMSSYLAYLVGSMFMYLGMRKFYKILGLQSRVTSIILIGITILVGWGLHAFIPHPVTWDQFTEHQYDLFELIPLVPIVCYSASAYLTLRIRAKVGAEYRRAFGWLAVGLTIQAGACISIGILELVGYDNWFFNSRAYEIPNILGDIGILTAAYYFNAIGLPASRTSMWRRLMGASDIRQTTSIDIILYVAGMASDSSKIDGYLDSKRLVTALQEGNDNDREALYDAYIHIEKYLVDEERLRSFTTKGLRADVTEHFGLDAGNSGETFWPRLQPV